MNDSPLSLRPAIFLDRDGVINENRADHVKTWSEFRFLPGALDALRDLAALGLPVIVVSNQGAIGRGLVRQQVVDEIHARMIAAVQHAGGRIDDVVYCPHHPDAGCACRKPKPGLLTASAARHGLDLPSSFLVGDAENDILAAQAAGCRPVLVQTGRGADQLALLRTRGVGEFYVAEELTDAIEWIAGQIRPRHVATTAEDVEKAAIVLQRNHSLA